MTGPGWETGPPQAPSNVSVTVATVEVADNVTAPVLDISWTEPSGGPAISHYEVRLGTRLLAKVPAGANSATVAAQGTGTQQVAVYAVGLDGSRSAAATKNVTITGGAIAQIQGKAVTSTFSIRGFLLYDSGTDSFRVGRMQYFLELRNVTVPAGGTSASVDLTTEGSVSGAVATPLSDPLGDRWWLTISGNTITINLSGWKSVDRTFQIAAVMQGITSDGGLMTV